MNEIIYFYPVNIRLDQKKAVCRIPQEVQDTETILKYFFHNLIKHPEIEEQDIFYFICLEEYVVLFKTVKEHDLTGMVFRFDMAMKVWMNIIPLINYLNSVMYKDIADGRSICPGDIQADIRPVSDMSDSIKKAFRNTYIPHSFITGRFSHSYYGVEEDSISFPQAEANQCNVHNNCHTGTQKQCIPYNKNINKTETNNKAVIKHKHQSESKKNIFKIIKDKIQNDSDFTDNIILECDEKSVYVNTLSDVYHIYDEPDSNLFRFDKIAECFKSSN